MFRMELTIAGRNVPVEIHDNPHLDEAAAVWLFKHFPMAEFDLDKLLSHFDDGVIKIGCGGGPLDEHPTNGKPRQDNVCAATLVADWIGDSVLDDPAAMKLLDFVCARDTKGRAPGGGIYDIAQAMKDLNRLGQDPPEEVMAWGVKALEGRYHGWQEYFLAGLEIKEKGNIHVIKALSTGRGGEFHALTIRSHSPYLKDYAFHELNIAVVIQQQNEGELAGNVQILTHRDFRVDMDDVAQVLRWVEQQFHLCFTGLVPVAKWEDLRAEGIFPDSDNPGHERLRGMAGWYYFRKARMLLNASESHPEIPPTKIPLIMISDLVIQCLDLTHFDEERAGSCREKNCTSTAQKPCPLYSRGLKRCRTIRHHMRKNGQ